MFNILKKIITIRPAIVNQTQIFSWKQYSSIVTGTEKCSTPVSRGLVLGVYAKEGDKLDIGQLTDTAQKYNMVNFALSSIISAKLICLKSYIGLYSRTFT